jgi:hypothetical protein
MVRAFLFEALDLALKVARCLLFLRRDPSLQHGVPFFGFSWKGFDSKMDTEVVFIVSMPRGIPISKADGSDFTIFGPFNQGGSRDTILFDSNSWWNII